jgi:hypothetical protein
MAEDIVYLQGQADESWIDFFEYQDFFVKYWTIIEFDVK